MKRWLLPLLLVTTGALATTGCPYDKFAPAGLPTVLTVESEISDSGGSHAGVYTVTTNRGPMVLKVRNTPMAWKPEALEVQEELAALGFAPKIYGLIEGDALAALRPQMAAKQKRKFLGPQKTDQGLFMEPIVEGWNCPKSGRPLPEASAKWDRAAILARIDEMDHALAQRNIRILDPQILIDSAGVPHLIDIEMVHRGSAERPASTNFKNIRDAFNEAWDASKKRR